MPLYVLRRAHTCSMKCTAYSSAGVAAEAAWVQMEKESRFEDSQSYHDDSLKKQPPVDEKMSNKEDNEIHSPARNIIGCALAPSLHADKAMSKHPPTLKTTLVGFQQPKFCKFGNLQGG